MDRPGGNENNLNILFLGEALRCPYKRPVSYKCRVHRDNTLRYVLAKHYRKDYRTVFFLIQI